MTSEELIDNKPDQLLEMIIGEITTKDMIEIRFEFEENLQWSVVSIFRENDDEISLRYHNGNKYFLYAGFYDENDEFHEKVKPLSEEQLATIPPTLTKLMVKVLDDEQGMRIPGNLLLK